MAETAGDQHRTGSGLQGAWHVVEDGLEHRDSGYFIDGDVLGLRRADGCWTWPLQLSEKSWCVMREFRLAFLAALERFGIAADAELDRSFALCAVPVARAPRPERFVVLGDIVRPKAPMRGRRPASAVRATIRAPRPAPVRLPAREGV